MDSTNILLWTLSLTLAVLGIAFGVIASYNSSRANAKIENLIANRWINEASERYFFLNIKEHILLNKKAITLLKKSSVKYSEYSMIASRARLLPMSIAASTKFSQTEYKGLADLYVQVKESVDNKFFDIIPDLSILTSSKPMPKKHKDLLIEYHQIVNTLISKIIKSYSKTITLPKPSKTK